MRLVGVVGSALSGEPKAESLLGGFALVDLLGDCVDGVTGVNGDIGVIGTLGDEDDAFGVVKVRGSGRKARSFRAYVRLTVGDREGDQSPRFFKGIFTEFPASGVGDPLGVKSICSSSSSVRSESSLSVNPVLDSGRWLEGVLGTCSTGLALATAAAERLEDLLLSVDTDCCGAMKRGGAGVRA